MCHTFTEGNAVGTPGNHHTAITPLYQLELTTDAQTERKQATLQTHPALHAYQSHALTDRQLVEWEHVRHSGHLTNDND